MHVDLRSRRRIILLAPTVLVVIGCTVSQGKRVVPSPASTIASSALLISQAELLRVAAGDQLLSAIQRTRPSWLAGRNGLVSVSIDDAPPTDPTVLGSVSISQVLDVRLVRATQSVGRPVVTSRGNVVVADLILVRTRLH